MVFLAYTMRRAVSILRVSDLIKREKHLFSRFLAQRRAVADVGTAGATEILAVVWRAMGHNGAGRLKGAGFFSQPEFGATKKEKNKIYK